MPLVSTPTLVETRGRSPSYSGIPPAGRWIRSFRGAPASRHRSGESYVGIRELILRTPRESRDEAVKVWHARGWRAFRASNGARSAHGLASRLLRPASAGWRATYHAGSGPPRP